MIPLTRSNDLFPFTGIYLSLAMCQYKLSLQNGKSEQESRQDVYDKILEVTTNVIEGNKQ